MLLKFDFKTLKITSTKQQFKVCLDRLLRNMINVQCVEIANVHVFKTQVGAFQMIDNEKLKNDVDSEIDYKYEISEDLKPQQEF